MRDIITYNYYGDKIRGLFMIAGVLMVIGLPFFAKIIDLPVTISIIAFLALAILGGFLNPIQKWIIILDSVVSVLAFAGFEYYAVHTYVNMTPNTPIEMWFFWFNQIFAVLFFIAIYLSMKTVRGRLMAEKSKVTIDDNPIRKV